MKKLLLFSVAAMVLSSASAQQIVDLTHGGSGTTTSVTQTFNETRGVSVTYSGNPFTVTSVTLYRFCTGSATDQGFVGLRIYSNSGALMVYKDSVVAPMFDDSVTFFIPYLLLTGQTIRICFYAYGFGNNNSSGSGFMYEPVFPYNTTTIPPFHVNQAYSSGTDTFPTAANIFVPFIRLTGTINMSVDESEHFPFTSISPNPVSASAVLKTNVPFDNAVLTIYNMYGQQVKQLNDLSGNSITLQREGLPAGVYFIRLGEDNTIIASDKLIIADR
jgi:hypothetical protein